jgi:hypothetical protein
MGKRNKHDIVLSGKRYGLGYIQSVDFMGDYRISPDCGGVGDILEDCNEDDGYYCGCVLAHRPYWLIDPRGEKGLRKRGKKRKFLKRT